MWSFLVAVLLVSAVCTSQAQKNEERDVELCEGGKRTIKCEHQEIDIVRANYGRPVDVGFCKGVNIWPINQNKICAGKDVSADVEGECQGLSECELHANNAELGDPCFGIKKYLQVTYKCVGKITPDDTKQERICENDEMSLECPEKRNIDIVWANFGRLKGGHICGDGLLGLLSWNQKCHNENNSLDKARAICQGKEYCTLGANVKTFGDACLLTRKYLEVRYRCCPKKGGC